MQLLRVQTWFTLHRKVSFYLCLKFFFRGRGWDPDTILVIIFIVGIRNLLIIHNPRVILFLNFLGGWEYIPLPSKSQVGVFFLSSSPSYHPQLFAYICSEYEIWKWAKDLGEYFTSFEEAIDWWIKFEFRSDLKAAANEPTHTKGMSNKPF